MTTDFATAGPVSLTLDPEQRVNYSLGLVLGVDEFQQEQFFHVERARQHARLLHGYGTVCGLRVTTSGSQVLVSAGVAVDPRGRVIDVAGAQCADLNQWLSVPANLQAATGPGSPVGPATAYVVLCYRECLTNKVPVPGAPCRSEDDTLAPSRITESFELKFSATRPAGAEEAAVLQFGALLRRIQVTSAPGPGTVLTVPAMEWLVRNLLLLGSPLGSPMGSPLGSPLVPPSGPLLLHPQDADSVLRAAFRVWVTEICPNFPSADECVLLAQLNFNVTAAGVIDPVPPPPITVLDADRPFLVSTRVMQESLFEAATEAGLALAPPPAPTLLGDVAGPVGTNTVQRIRNVAVDPTAPHLNDVLMGIPDGVGGVRWGPGQFATVAAGNVQIGTPPPANTTLSGLQAVVQNPVGSGRVVLTFTGFNAAARYVVNVLPSMEGVALPTPPAPAVMPQVMFLGASAVAPAGLQLAVYDARLGTPVTDAFLRSMRLLVQIAQLNLR